MNGLEAGQVVVDAPLDDAGWLYFGATPQVDDFPLAFGGLIDEILLYDHALSAADVERLTTGIPGQCVAASSPSLTLTATAVPDAAPVRGVVSFNLTVTNTSNGYLDEIELVNELPPRFTFIDANRPIAGQVGQRVRLAAGPLLAGESTSIAIRTFAPSVDGHFTNHAVATSHGLEVGADATIDIAPDSCYITPTDLVGRWSGEPDQPPYQLTDYPLGRVGYASRAFANQALRVGPSPLAGASTATIGGWIQALSLNTGWQAVLMTSDVNVGVAIPEESRLFLGIHNGHAVFVTSHLTGQRTTIAPGALATGRWYCLAASFDGAIARLYLDGTLVAETAANEALTSGAVDERLSLGVEFDGLLDEVVAYLPGAGCDGDSRPRARVAGDMRDQRNADARESRSAKQPDWRSGCPRICKPTIPAVPVCCPSLQAGFPEDSRSMARPVVSAGRLTHPPQTSTR